MIVRENLPLTWRNLGQLRNQFQVQHKCRVFSNSSDPLDNKNMKPGWSVYLEQKMVIGHLPLVIGHWRRFIKLDI